MKHRALRTLALAALTACAHPLPRPPAADLPPAPPIAGVVPLARPGEALTFSVSLRGMEGGRARVAVGGMENGVIAARGQAESAGVVASVVRAADELSTLIDAASGLPREVFSVAVTRGKEVRVHATYAADHSHAALEVVTDGRPSKVRRRLPTDAPTFDTLGAMMVMRAWQVPEGTRARFFSLGGQKLWRVEVTMGPTERVDTIFGPVMARRIDGVSTRLRPDLKPDPDRPPRAFSAWFSADERAVPVKIRAATEFGDAVATLTSYTPGATDEPTAEK
jgi:hypothetical protein